MGALGCHALALQIRCCVKCCYPKREVKAEASVRNHRHHPWREQSEGGAAQIPHSLQFLGKGGGGVGAPQWYSPIEQGPWVQAPLGAAWKERRHRCWMAGMPWCSSTWNKSSCNGASFEIEIAPSKSNLL